MPNHRKGKIYPPKSGIVITLKTNPSGSKAYRVDIAASITGGLREQKQFPALAEAQEYASRRYEEIKNFGHSAFSLTAKQRDDATRAIALLTRYHLTLEDAAKLAVKHIPKAIGPITVTELRKRFLEAPGRRKTKIIQRRPLTLHNLSWRTARYERAFGKEPAAGIETYAIRTWMQSLGLHSPVSLNNYRRALHAMFSFGVTEGYCTSNPVASLPLFVVPERAPSILTVEHAKALIRTAADTEGELGLLAYVTLGLFAGLRRAEIERIDGSAVNWERRMVTVDGSIAKTGSIRNVALSPNALEWLKRVPAMSGRIAPKNLNHRFRRLRFLAGIEKWDGNELRHSFASYHFDLHQNGPLTAAQLGHSSGCQLLFEHYRSLVPLGDGERFFAIMPETTSIKNNATMPA